MGSIEPEIKSIQALSNCCWLGTVGSNPKLVHKPGSNISYSSWYDHTGCVCHYQWALHYIPFNGHSIKMVLQ